MKAVAALVLAFALAGCAGGNGVAVSDARVAEPFANTTALYFDAENHEGVDDRLLSVSGSAFEEARFHEMTIDDDGFATMVDADAFVVPAGGMVRLAPGSRHVMLLDIEPRAVGEVVVLELVWEHAGVMMIEADVVPAGTDW